MNVIVHFLALNLLFYLPKFHPVASIPRWRYLKYRTGLILLSVKKKEKSNVQKKSGRKITLIEGDIKKKEESKEANVKQEYKEKTIRKKFWSCKNFK